VADHRGLAWLGGGILAAQAVLTLAVAEPRARALKPSSPWLMTLRLSLNVK
jgi:hypothetical protein